MLIFLLCGFVEPIFAQMPAPMMVHYFNTGGFGLTGPQGIAYISDGPHSGCFAIIDNSADAVFIICPDGDPVFQESFSTVSLGALNAKEICYMPGTSEYAIFDDNLDAILIVDALGVLQRQLTVGFISGTYTGIAYIPQSGNLAIVDNSADEVYIIDQSCDSEGVLRAIFDTTPFSTTPRGIAYDSDSNRMAIVDSGSDQVTIIDLPGLLALPERCTCDLNNDGKCNSLDYQTFIQDWDSTDCP